jgi:Kef-type K+ transport system membrane component KefB
LCAGIIGGKIAGIFKLPNVSGYLVAGLLIGPSLLKFVSPDDVGKFGIISEFALAIIAFSIGSEFVFSEIKKMGKKIMIITLTEVVGAVVIVFSVMFFIFNQPFAFSIVIASMSAATAPAATLLVMRQYRAHGPLTKTILPVVALDDVYGIVIFGISISLAVMSVSNIQYSAWQMISKPLVEVGGSILLGIGLGLALTVVYRLSKTNSDNQVLALGAIGVATGLSSLLGLSPLLTNILMGVMVVNFVKRPERVFKSVNDFSAPVYLLFFTLAGASLDIKILATVGLMGLAYVFARASGKMIGAWVGAKMTKAEPVVQKYLGLALLPQGGVSIGLSVIVTKQLPQYSVAINTIIMFSVLIYEISGPIFAKIAITKANEINGLDLIKDINDTAMDASMDVIQEA